jgi:general nucleoside transport system permease protein
MLDTVLQGIFSAAFIASILRVATPILLPSLGALISGRAGVSNIGLEGMMLVSAFTGVVVSAFSQQWFGPEAGLVWGPWLGMVIGVSVSILLALMLGYFHLKLKTDLFLAGVALNVLGSAGTVAIMFELTGDRGNTSTLASLVMPFIRLPTQLQDFLRIGESGVGKILYDVFDNQSLMTWIAFISVFVVWFMLYRTPFGMHLRATGENPSAAASVGIPVQRTQFLALILSGLFAGLGGIHMSMGYLSLFQANMTAGRGFIALATPLLGNNNPYGTAVASLVFGFFDALAIRVGSLQIPSMLPQMIPYVATVMALVIYALQTRQSQRVRALRAAEGEGTSRGYWGAVQRISLLHVLMSMIAVIGIILAVSLLSAPNGFGGVETAYPVAAAVGIVSIILVVINLPFLTRVERIRGWVWQSAAAVGLSLAVYVTLLLALFNLGLILMVAIGLIVGFLAWVILGGWLLILQPLPTLPAQLGNTNH